MSIQSLFNNLEKPLAGRNPKAGGSLELRSGEPPSADSRLKPDPAESTLSTRAAGPAWRVGQSSSAAASIPDRFSLIQTAGGALDELHAILQRIRDLSVQAAGTPDVDRQALQQEVTRLVGEINLVHQSTVQQADPVLGSLEVLVGQMSGFGTPLNADWSRACPLVTGESKLTGGVPLSPGAAALGVAGLAVTTSDLAQESIYAIDQALNRVNRQRTHLAALQVRLERAVRSFNVAAENVLASGSRIRDLNLALESANTAGNRILRQSHEAARAQANAHPQVVLQLLS